MGARELTASEKRGIRKLVARKCACYDGGTGTCLPLDAPCYMCGKAWSGDYCGYFERAVLPQDAQLEAALLGRDITERQKTCPVCGKVFVPRTSQVYCSEKCRAQGRREYYREHKRRSRRNSA